MHTYCLVSFEQHYKYYNTGIHAITQIKVRVYTLNMHTWSKIVNIDDAF